VYAHVHEMKDWLDVLVGLYRLLD